MVRLGLVGRGAWSRNIAATLDAIEGVAWEPVVLPGLARGLDGVIIANKSRDHADTAIALLRAGIPCLIEKPVATSLADFERIREASRNCGVPAFAGHIHLFNPACETFLAQIPRLGRINLVHGAFANNRARDDVSVIWDWFPHPLSIAGRIFKSPPTSVTATSLDGEERPLAAQASVTYGDIDFEMTASWLSDEPRMEITVEGEAGSVTFNDKAERKVSLKIDQEISYPAYSADPPLLRELCAFTNVVRGEISNPSSLGEAEDVMVCLDAIERSIGAKGRVEALKS